MPSSPIGLRDPQAELYEACFGLDAPGIARALSEGANPNALDHEGNPPWRALVSSDMQGQDEIVSQCLAALCKGGMKLSVASRKGFMVSFYIRQTPLCAAVLLDHFGGPVVEKHLAKVGQKYVDMPWWETQVERARVCKNATTLDQSTPAATKSPARKSL